MGMKRSCKDYIISSMRTIHINRSKKMYKAYPRSNFDQSNKPIQEDTVGNYQQWGKLIGIGLNMKNITSTVELFYWSFEELKGFNILKAVATRDTLDDKTYKHICYLFESAYALDIEPRRNILGNPGCEWQLNHFVG